MRRRVLPLLLVLTAVAAVLAASASGAKKDVRLNLVAYSTPKPVLTKIISDFQADARGLRRQLQRVVRRLVGPGGGRRGRSAGGRRAPQHGRRHAATWPTRGSCNTKWDKQSYKGVAFQSVVVFALRDGNPKKIKGWNDLLKPGVEVVTPNPFTAGIAKWNILAAYAAQRRSARPTRRRSTSCKKLFRPRRRAGLVGQQRDEHVPVRQGRRAPHLRERGDQRAPRGPEHPVRDPAPDDADRHLHGRDDEEPEQGRGERVPPVPEVAARAGGPRPERLPAREQAGRQRSSRSSSRCARARSRSTTR